MLCNIKKIHLHIKWLVDDKNFYQFTAVYFLILSTKCELIHGIDGKNGFNVCKGMLRNQLINFLYAILHEQHIFQNKKRNQRHARIGCDEWG